MIKGKKDFLDNVANQCVCAEHGTPVVVAWHAAENSYVLRCGKGHYPEEVTELRTLTQALKAGEDIPEPIKGNIIKAQQKRATASGKGARALVLGDVPRADLATGEMLLPEVIQELLHYAAKYALDPYRQHVYIMYGKPYISLDGYLYHANKSGKPYTLSSHPLTEGEKKDYMIDLEDHAWLAQVIFTGTDQAFSGIGIVTRGEITAKSTKHPEQLRSPVVAAHPWQLAQKRAEWQALRRAFPIGETEETNSTEEG